METGLEKKEPETKELAIKKEVAIQKEMSIDDMVNQVDKVNQLYKRVLKPNFHYGIIPGCGDKPTLLKPGAEKILLMFMLSEKVDKDEVIDLENGHRENKITIGLYHRITDEFWGHGCGSCSTMESKFRYRNASKKCPECGKEAIIKGKAEYGGGWLCYKKKGGCGAKFTDDAPAIITQPEGRVENPDIADTYNTVLKMAKKRALVDAVLNGTGVSDIFTQDIEDIKPGTGQKNPVEKKEPVKNVTPAETKSNLSKERKELTDVIMEDLRILGVTTVQDAEKKTGLTNEQLKSVPLKDLEKVRDELNSEVMEKKPFESPIMDEELPFAGQEPGEGYGSDDGKPIKDMGGKIK